MTNQFREEDNSLVPVDYGDILSKLDRLLRDRNPFKVSKKRNKLLANFDAIATELARQSCQNPLHFTRGVKVATVNFSPGFERQFPQLINKIQAALKKHLNSLLLDEENLAELVAKMSTDLDSFQTLLKLDKTTYKVTEFSDNFEKQSLTIDTDLPGSSSIFKFHKLTITVSQTERFREEVEEAVMNYIRNQNNLDSDEIEELQDIFQSSMRNPASDFNNLQRLVDQESLGKLKREACLLYLEHLLENIQTNQQHVDVIYLRDLMRRLRAIEDYVNDLNKADSDYEVNYAGVAVNYKDFFSRAEAFDSLPIIPLIEGHLGENTDPERGEVEFIFGLKLKLNHPVQAYGKKSVFEYNIDLLNPDSETHRNNLADPDRSEAFARKVLYRFFLYYCVFASKLDPSASDYNPDAELEYNAIASFTENVLPILQGSDETAKQSLFRGTLKGFKKYKVNEKIDRLKNLLKRSIARQSILPAFNRPVYIRLSKGVLQPNIERMFNHIFFQEVVSNNPKQALRYISIVKAGLETDALSCLSARIKIEDLRYFRSPFQEQFNWEYVTSGISTLPVLWGPDTPPCDNFYQNNLKNVPWIIFAYDPMHLKDNLKTPESVFLYKFAWTILAYLSLDIILEYLVSKSFVPQIRLHEGNEKNPVVAEKFMANLSKTLAHLFSKNMRSNSQGFRIHTLKQYAATNGLSSLYSVLPKMFSKTSSTREQVAEADRLKKLAIVVVSSRESDAMFRHETRQNRIANLIGEAIGVERSPDGRIRVERLQTFVGKETVRQLYVTPKVLMDTIAHLYADGYQHIVYIAQTPYSSTLHITRTNTDDELYFMSGQLIQYLKQNLDNLTIYPVFFDKYYVRKLRDREGESSWAIEDTQELTRLWDDPRQQAVVFFNLLTGSIVGKSNRDNDRFYNGAISYSTLLNIYRGVLDDRNIREGLIYDSPLKQQILESMALLHFSRFEKNTQRSFKLDPYQTIIGEKSCSALSTFDSMSPGIEFNSLAFLSEVSQVLNKF
ncbi:hypothetical protein JJD41_10160 [Oxynema sp. CENA135]|uniref:hypothetical protein n=1 Tax=Oxynema sp. CENA135 TaxID=984206 RepID=UPI00190AFC5C|nr:hypothetical protein [Oxynema sp. CENA135]MBK4730221.1 hypothetical protein [Oxynema sp. CENA135]